jgi:hypothetical protein
MLRLHAQVMTNDGFLPQMPPASRRTRSTAVRHEKELPLTATGRCRIQALHLSAGSAVLLGRPKHPKATLPVLKNEFREDF